MKESAPEHLIRAYLTGELAREARDEFEKQLATDSQLAKALTQRRLEMAAAELLIADEMREMFKNWQKQQRSFSGKTHLFRFLLVAAALVITVLAVRIFMPEADRTTPPAPQPATPKAVPPVVAEPTPVPVLAPPKQRQAPNYLALARKNLENPTLPELRRAATDNSAGAYTLAQKAFAEGKYQETLRQLSKTDSTKRQSAAFLTAHAYFRLGRYEPAAEKFEELITSNSRQYLSQSEWGLLMCRLALHPQQKTEFRKQLNDILAHPEHPFYQHALELQKKIKE